GGLGPRQLAQDHNEKNVARHGTACRTNGQAQETCFRWDAEKRFAAAFQPGHFTCKLRSIFSNAGRIWPKSLSGAIKTAYKTCCRSLMGRVTSQSRSRSALPCWSLIGEAPTISTDLAETPLTLISWSLPTCRKSGLP